LQIRKLFCFEAAHALPHHPGKCARMHGHSYRLEVAIGGPLQKDGPSRGMVEDFDALDALVRVETLDALDHRTINDLIENPTAEEIVLWIWRRLEPKLPSLEELVLWETPTACAILRRSDYAGAASH
jgi:6-pyruvoyltetrahydropterin/6-carboxytetrahydropterin synthase